MKYNGELTSRTPGRSAESIAQRCPIRDREAAQAFRGQAEDYYDAATTGRLSAVKPVLLYYSFLNLAKAYIVTTGLRHVLVDPKHGLSEKANLRQIAGAIVRAHPTDRSPSLLMNSITLLLGDV